MFVPPTPADTRSRRGAWSEQTVWTQTASQVGCPALWEPVSAAAPPAWQEGPLTGAVRTSLARGCSMGNPTTPSEIHLTVTGMKSWAPACFCSLAASSVCSGNNWLQTNYYILYNLLWFILKRKPYDITCQLQGIWSISFIDAYFCFVVDTLLRCRQ